MHFYSNTTIVGSGADRAARAVASLDTPSFVSPAGGATIVFAESDEIGLSSPPIARELSAAADCFAITVAVRYDEFAYQAYNNGVLIDVAVLPADAGAWPRGDAVGLTSALGGGDIDALRRVLLSGPQRGADLHHQLFEALELPTLAVGWSYSTITTDGLDYIGALVETRAADGMSILV